ncbi:MAG TPA: hypothetical protein VH370_00075 [Humisphaera sp.]|jgi:hypothetical protein|nr:hypothetical protein [Humisphaera sp.]
MDRRYFSERRISNAQFDARVAYIGAMRGQPVQVAKKYGEAGFRGCGRQKPEYGNKSSGWSFQYSDRRPAQTGVTVAGFGRSQLNRNYP